jgi:hypothetical protein
MHAHARRMEVLSTMEAAPRYAQGCLELQSSPLQKMLALIAGRDRCILGESLQFSAAARIV